MRKNVILICEECSSRNYTVSKNDNSKERIVLVKYCKKCNKRTVHKESR
ncbi:MAG: 50S ribosomal protein L33 [Gammaproteobacteria bacterium]|nr:50S ribosomal protein L33 [Gammaproteobacteria bacterium]